MPYYTQYSFTRMILEFMCNIIGMDVILHDIWRCCGFQFVLLAFLWCPNCPFDVSVESSLSFQCSCSVQCVLLMVLWYPVCPFDIYGRGDLFGRGNLFGRVTYLTGVICPFDIPVVSSILVVSCPFDIPVVSSILVMFVR